MFLRSVVILGQSEGFDPQSLHSALPPLLVLSVGWPQTVSQRALVAAILARAADLAIDVEARLVCDTDDALDTLLPGDQMLNASPAAVVVGC